MTAVIQSASADTLSPVTARRRQTAGGGQRSHAQATALIVAVLLLAGAAVWSSGAAALLALVLAGAAWLRRWLPWDVAIPAAVAVLLLVAVAVAQLSFAAGLDVTGSRAQALAALALLVAGCVLAMRIPASAGLRTLPAGPWALVAFLPSLAALVTGLANAFSSAVASRWVADAPDPSMHAGFVADIRAQGGLDYAHQQYPQALHSLAAWLDTAAAQPQTLIDRLAGVAGLSWLALALLMMVATAVAMRFAADRGTRFQALVGLSTGVVLAGMNGFIMQFPLTGAHTSIVAIAVLLLPLLIADARRSRDALVLLPVLVALAANLWTPVLIAGAVLALGWTITEIAGRGVASVPRLARDLLLPGVVAMALLIPLLTATGRAGGLALAAIPGGAWFPAAALLLVIPASVVSLLVPVRHALAAQALLLVAGCALMLTVVALGTDDPLRLRQWYPTKCLWVLIVVATPFAVGGIARAVAAYMGLSRPLARRARVGPRSARLLLAALAACTVAVAAGSLIWEYTTRAPIALLPWQPTSDVALRSKYRISVVERYATAFAPARALPVAIEWLPGRKTFYSNITGRMFSLMTGQPAGYGSLEDLCAQVRSIGRPGRVVIISPAPRSQVQHAANAGGCGATPVVRIAPMAQAG